MLGYQPHLIMQLQVPIFAQTAIHPISLSIIMAGSVLHATLPLIGPQPILIIPQQGQQIAKSVISIRDPLTTFLGNVQTVIAPKHGNLPALTIPSLWIMRALIAIVRFVILVEITNRIHVMPVMIQEKWLISIPIFQIMGIVWIATPMVKKRTTIDFI